MPYFQNISTSEFIGVYVISDRKYSKDYRVKPGSNTSMLMRSQPGPYNLSTTNYFVIKYSPDAGNSWYPLGITLTTGSARTSLQVCDDLNGNANFSAMFTAMDLDNCVVIRSVTSANTSFRAYIPNISDSANPETSAEKALKFNLKCPVVEMPTYFSRYAIGNYPGALLVQLTQPNEDFVITNAGLSTTPKEDWEFLDGTSGLFQFRKMTVDGSNRTTSIIEYSAGARSGDLAKKTQYTYTDANTMPDQVTEIPYTLTGDDLVTPA